MKEEREEFSEVLLTSCVSFDGGSCKPEDVNTETDDWEWAETTAAVGGGMSAWGFGAVRVGAIVAALDGPLPILDIPASVIVGTGVGAMIVGGAAGLVGGVGMIVDSD